MAAPRHLPLLLLAVPLLLLAAGLASAVAVEDSSEDQIRIRVRYPSDEESRWLDRWAAKYQAAPGSGDGSFKVQPATDEESATLNRMLSGGTNKKGAAGGDSHGRRRAGFDGHIENVTAPEYMGPVYRGRGAVSVFHSSVSVNVGPVYRGFGRVVVDNVVNIDGEMENTDRSRDEEKNLLIKAVDVQLVDGIRQGEGSSGQYVRPE
ncbi:hypothetical protein ACP70R_018199 [Stipagrostis hirtigluma subsp. patula]